MKMTKQLQTTGFETLEEAKENVTEVYSTIVYDKSDNSSSCFAHQPERSCVILKCSTRLLASLRR
jgi:hypothetical protein